MIEATTWAVVGFHELTDGCECVGMASPVLNVEILPSDNMQLDLDMDAQNV